MVLEKVEDSLLEMNRLVVVLAASHTNIELKSCLLGVWHPGREGVAAELSITGFISKYLMLVPGIAHCVIPCFFGS